MGNVRVMTGGQGDRRADEQKAANHCGGTVGSRSTRTPGTELQNNKSGAKSEQTQTESEQNKSDFTAADIISLIGETSRFSDCW